MRVQELEADEAILEMSVHNMSRENFFFRKLIIVYIDALFEYYIAIICSVCINSL